MATLKYSRQRESIKEFLTGRTDHPTADFVYENMKQIYPNISLGTVYRNLNQLVEQGVLRRIATPVSGDRFDIRTDPHAHLLCTRCGKVLDLEDDLISELDRNVMRTTGFLVNDRQLLLSGICADCLAAQQVRLTEETEDQQAV